MGLLTVLGRAYRSGFTVSSDFARQWAPDIGKAASLGLITTYIPSMGFTKTWRCTARGAEYLEES